MLTRPIALGADLVMHSATKYLNGHSDVVAGALTAARAGRAVGAPRRPSARSRGAILGPFEAWLLLRGMRTLYVRVRQAGGGAQLAEHFAGHPAIAAVLYPGLPDHPGHALAARQMRGGFGGMLSIRVQGGEAAAIATPARVRLWKRATSLGGVESLIEHRASIEGPTSPVPARPAAPVGRPRGARRPDRRSRGGADRVNAGYQRRRAWPSTPPSRLTARMPVPYQAATSATLSIGQDRV